MARGGRPANGSIRARRLADGRTAFQARFTVHGRPETVTLGHSPEWNRPRAEEELQNILADVRRGVWTPHTPTTAPEAPTIGELADEFEDDAKARGLREKSVAAIAHDLSHLSSLYDRRVTDLTDRDVKDLIVRKTKEREILTAGRQALGDGKTLDELTGSQRAAITQYGRTARGLSPNSIRRVLGTLGALIELARQEHDVALTKNVALNKRNWPIADTPDRAHAEIDQIEALLTAARQLDEEAPSHRKIGRPLLIGLLFLAGLRISELGALDRADVDLAGHRISIGTTQRTKTTKSYRDVNIIPKLEPLRRTRLDQIRASNGEALLFTSAGQRWNADNVRSSFATIVTRANEILSARDAAPLPANLTSHAGRRSFATALALNGESPDYIISQLGHSSAAFTFEVYRQATSRRGRRDSRLRTWFGPPGGK